MPKPSNLEIVQKSVASARQYLEQAHKNDPSLTELKFDIKKTSKLAEVKPFLNALYPLFTQLLEVLKANPHIARNIKTLVIVVHLPIPNIEERILEMVPLLTGLEELKIAIFTSATRPKNQSFVYDLSHAPGLRSISINQYKPVHVILTNCNALETVHILTASLEITGIEDFTQLKTITIQSSKDCGAVLNIDLTNSPVLEKVYLRAQNLRSVGQFKSDVLTELDLGSNLITTLDLSHCSGLTAIVLNLTNLTHLAATFMPNMRNFVTNNTKLSQSALLAFQLMFGDSIFNRDTVYTSDLTVKKVNAAIPIIARTINLPVGGLKQFQEMANAVRKASENMLTNDLIYMIISFLNPSLASINPLFTNAMQMPPDPETKETVMALSQKPIAYLWRFLAPLRVYDQVIFNAYDHFVARNKLDKHNLEFDGKDILALARSQQVDADVTSRIKNKLQIQRQRSVITRAASPLTFEWQRFDAGEFELVEIAHSDERAAKRVRLD